MIGRARTLRRKSTFPERLVWSRLRDRRCYGLKFRRQHPIGRFVADFFCETAGVVVELDGRSHADQAKYDWIRQQWLEQQGLRVLRFPHARVLEDLHDLIESIAAAFLL